MSTDPTIRVLHVDDASGFTDVVSEFLVREDSRIRVRTAESAEEGLTRLEETDFDCVVSDYEMPGKNGLQFLHDVRETHSDMPFILFTAKGSEEIASDAISAGVTDYLRKEGGSGQYTLLAHRIANAVSQYRSKREIETSQKRLSLFFERSPLGAIEWNDDFEVIRINETGEEILGYDEAELVGSSWRRLVPESEQDAVAKVLSELDSTAAVNDSEYETVTKGGERLVCEWHHRVVRNDHGDAVTTFSKFQDVTDRVERRRQLARERAFTEQALDTLDDLFYVLDADGDLQRWNERLARETGFADEELLDRDVLEFFAEDHRQRVTEAIETTIDTGTATVEADVLTADRGRVSYELTGQRLVDPDGDFLGLAGIGRDLSDRKARERELEFARDLLDKTEQIADVGGWQIDTTTNEVYWSDHLFEMIGIEGEEEPPLEDALDVYVDADRPIVEQAIEDAIAAGDSFDVEARFQRSDDEIRWFRILGEPVFDDGDVVQLRGAVQDVTDRKRHEHDLERAREEYEQLFNGMNDTGWVVDLDGRFLAVNDTAVERTGYSREELLSMGSSDIDAHLDDDDIATLIDELSEDETQVLETVHRTKRGEEIPVELSSTMITYDGEPAILTIGRDITERKERERRLEQFASTVSHDLRNPLSVAEGHVELARDDCESDHLDGIAEAHERMETLIEELLTLAREGNTIGSTETVDLGTFVTDCWEDLDTAEGSLENETSRRIAADGSRLKQLVENLVRNAIEHAGTTVTVTVGDLEDGFFIEDDGDGIPEDRRDDVFRPGYSTAEGGTGFGLSIVKEIADAHGWEVRVTEGSAGGARFEFTGVEPAD
ncbi:PAS domain S-box protein [Halorubrum aethiopicum]|uniref:PAS domain S-box protein n=1 Tax=Halorubrum aethiopicum TaxID=1758255 RepID=UPI00082EC87D|nr:PAS domain S-box protein [Halorubrum aethiopicum]